MKIAKRGHSLHFDNLSQALVHGKRQDPRTIYPSRMPTTNYVICAWSGPRRTLDPRTDADPAFYLRAHFQCLADHRHNLSQITLVVPENPNEPPAYRQYLLAELPKKIGTAEVVLIERPNIGMSYGSFSDCYARYRTSFDYYFFMEDDYFMCQHDFDKIHVDLMEEDRMCGYLCGMAWAPPDHEYHAGISNGILRSEALEKVFLALGHLPHSRDSLLYGPNEQTGQVGQSREIINAGYTLRDWAGHYRVGFKANHTKIIMYHPECPSAIMMPL